MTDFRGVRRALPPRLTRATPDAEIDAELRAHLESLAEELCRQGMEPDVAWQEAVRRFGDVKKMREEVRRVDAPWEWKMKWLESWVSTVQDVRYGLRQLRRNPGFAAVAVLTLALGIGVTTAMFTVVNGVLLGPLPFPESDRLVAVGVEDGDAVGEPFVRLEHYADIESANVSFANVATYLTFPSTTLAQLDEPVTVTTGWVSEDFFEVLGLEPAVGRFLLPGAGRRADDTSVVLGNSLWRSRFGGDPSVVGRTAVVDGVPRAIVGVMPDGFDFDTDLFLPLEAHPLRGAEPALWGSVVARLGEGASPTLVRSELEELAVNAGWRLGGRDRGLTVRVLPLKDVLVGEGSRYQLLIFGGAVALVLLISVTNVANLLLMRARTREAEIGLRKVMGADEPRLVRQLLTESLLLAGGAGVLGIGITALGLEALLRLAPPGTLPRGQEPGVDVTALGFALVVSLVSGIAFGLAPALTLGRRDLRTTLSGASGTHTRGCALGRDLLVVSEVGLALVLLTGATLLARSFYEIRSIDPGFDPAGTMSYTVGLPELSYSEIEPTLVLHQTVLDGLASIPGVRDAGAANSGSPFRGMTLTTRVGAEGQRERTVGTTLVASSPGYFRALGISRISGRDFTALDDASAPGVTVVSRTLAELLWPDMNPLGRRIVLGPEKTLTVIGVVEDIMRPGPTAQTATMMFQPMAQVQDVRQLRQMIYVVRASEQTRPLAPEMREIMHKADSDIPTGRFTSLNQLVDDAMGYRVFQTRLLATFAMMAVLLAGIGVYGVMAYSVTERTREMGIRISLGGRPRHLIGTAISRVGRLVFAGIAIGTLGAYGMGRLLTAWLYAVSPGDPVSLVVSVLILVSVALIAALGPVRRALRISPAQVLTE